MILLKCVLILLFGTINISYTVKTTQVTLPIQVRVAILKKKLSDQVKSTYEKNPSEVITLNEEVEYIDHENEPITPINEKDPRKKKQKYKLKEIRTTRDIGQNFKSEDDFVSEIPSVAQKSKKSVVRNHPSKERPSNHTQKPIKRKKAKKSKITDVFYRRLYTDNKLSDKWIHCQDLITPFLTGHKRNMTETKRVSYDNPLVLRLIQLLKENLTNHTKDDIHSILYQISNLQLRFFQWDVAAIKLLLNFIHRDKSKRHSFKTIKTGLKVIFANWKLDFSSHTDVLMKQSRIFRPPCIKITDRSGSTKTPSVVRYTKSVRPKKCFKADPDYDSCVTKTFEN